MAEEKRLEDKGYSFMNEVVMVLLARQEGGAIISHVEVMDPSDMELALQFDDQSKTLHLWLREKTA